MKKPYYAVLGEDGAVTFPEQLREKLGLKIGTLFELEVTQDGKILLAPGVFVASLLQQAEQEQQTSDSLLHPEPNLKTSEPDAQEEKPTSTTEATGNWREVLDDFKKRLSLYLKVNVTPWERDGYRKNPNLLALGQGLETTLLYVKVSATSGFWGLGPDELDALDASGWHWFVILLSLGERAYLLRPQEIDAHKKKHWKKAKDGDYKVHENDLSPASRSETYDQFFERLANQPNLF